MFLLKLFAVVLVGIAQVQGGYIRYPTSEF